MWDVSGMENWRAKGGEDLSLPASAISVTLLQTGPAGRAGYFGSSQFMISPSYLNYTTSGGRFTLESFTADHAVFPPDRALRSERGSAKKM